MKKGMLVCAVAVIAVGLVVPCVATQVDDTTPKLLRGIINDYTVATGIGGPWEMHGSWLLKLDKHSGKAEFSAVMTMEHNDYFILANPSSASVDNPASRGAHTHHISMTGQMTADTGTCPADSPATTVRFVITGQPSITGNGNPAPFEAKGPSSLQICVSGGEEVEYSNVTLQLSGLATTHFGSQAIHGVVRIPHKSGDRDDDRDGDRNDDHHSH